MTAADRNRSSELKKKKQPGYPSHTPLDVRMKEFESVTDYSLVPGIPVYVRLDGRAFHTFCRGLGKPFDMDFAGTVKEVAKYLHGKTNALVSFCQSDEISLVYEAPEKMPFGTRLFKIQSVMAGMCSAAFCVFGSRTAMKDRIERSVPHFDCRVCQMSLAECANMIVWRSRDAAKNSVTQLALSRFSDRDIHGKDGLEKIAMLHLDGIDYYALPEDLRIGAFFRREVYEKELTDEEVSRIPEKNRVAGADGKIRATRSRISQFYVGGRLEDVANKEGFLFGEEKPVFRQGNTPDPV